MRNKLLTFLLALHLFVVFLGTGLVDFSAVPRAMQGPVSYYLAICGGHPYNFFSPDIPKQVVVNCYITDSSGAEHTEAFAEKKNSYQLRANYLFQLLDNINDPQTAARLAARDCFKRYKGAAKVRIEIGRYIVPPVEDFKQGKKAGIASIYTQTFTHE